MFEFATPHFLWILALLPLLGWWVLRRARRRRASIQFSDLNLFASTPAGMALVGRRALPVLRLTAMALLVVALARPRFGTVERDIIREGVDLFYCLDISGSMRAEDFQPNRLGKAKELMAQFAAGRPMDRQGIVLFSGASFVLCPLTFDGKALQEFLASVTFDDVGVQGTAIGMGLSRALKKMQESKAKSKVIVVMTDGVNNTGEITPLQAAQVAKKLGVRVYTIGIGSHGRARITVPTQFGPRSQWITTEIDEELLKKIADETGGIYRRAATEKELEAVFREIDRLEKSEIELKEYRTYDERAALASWPALVLLLLEIALANTRFLKIP
jgi:Ca-activated chloride channel family protein